MSTHVTMDAPAGETGDQNPTIQDEEYKHINMNQGSKEEKAMEKETIHESGKSDDINRENGLGMVNEQEGNEGMTETTAHDKVMKDTCKSKVNDRRKRFVDTGKKSAFFKSKTLNELRPFYNSCTLDERMAEIRKSIYYIRQHWDEFDTFLASLRQLMLRDGEVTFDSPDVQSYMERLLTTKRSWLQEFEVAFLDISYDAIKLYTCSEGYSQIYRLSNEIFRREDSIDVREMIQCVTFLVELINIDLFNYCLKRPEMMHYEGMVYRGMCLNDADLHAFKALRHETIDKRNIAVPLGLFSGSSSLDVALSFIEEGLENTPVGKPRQTPLLIKTTVISLKKEYIEYYTSRFPTSVLTTICAVDVHHLSVFPDEFEVLLRGPFMLVLDVYKDGNLLEEPCDVLEAVMLNANRDHISTAHLGEQDTLARNMFATMVAVTRSEFAMKYCEEHGLTRDRWEYHEILQDNMNKLNILMNDDLHSQQI